MRGHIWVMIAGGCWLAAGQRTVGDDELTFRPPAVPLVTHDPYFSVWSLADRLTDEWSRHWTGVNQAMCGMCRIDGQTYRFLGPQPSAAGVMEQKSLHVWPTRTIYEFEASGLALTLTFLSPLLPNDLDVLARPVTYVAWSARSADGKPHEVSLYFDCSAEWVVNVAEQRVVASRCKLGSLSALRCGSLEQPMLEKAGDNLRIDWGYLYLAIPGDGAHTEVIASDVAARGAFVANGTLPDTDDLRFPRAARDAWPVLACALDLGSVGAAPVARHVLLAYDDVYSLEYLQRRLRPYWRRAGMEPDALLKAAERDYAELSEKCRAFDAELMADLTRAGGPKYARLAALAYRQTLAAHKLAADFDGTPLMFPKENFSNGCIGTVDVIFPSAPFFLLLSPRLLEAQLRPVLDYGSSARWRHPFAPHDLGTYPLANGQVYGGGERTEEDQMPVEESGNMLILLAALAQTDGNADFAGQWWPVVSRWAAYLREKGLDPENQLCTDDFAGHLAHNANLSIKAIVALGAYARLCELRGKADEAAEYRRVAEQFAGEWAKMADDGDHYRLTFDQPGTWSQKYNLVWDKVLHLGLFPAQIARTEVAYYRTKLNRFGVPLDGRETYAKLDFAAWTAALAEERADFAALAEPLYDFADGTPDRVPLTDWYQTTDGRCVGFRARSVVGGVYVPLLLDAKMWQKWREKGK